MEPINNNILSPVIDHTYDALLGIPSPPMTWGECLILTMIIIASIGTAIVVFYFLRYQVPKLEYRRKHCPGC